MLRALLFGVLAQTSVALKFCANKYLPSGSCPENAQEICAAKGNFCLKSDPVAVEYSVDGVNGCEQFTTGGHSGEACFGTHVSDNPSDNQPNCYPTHRTYCECVECTQNSECSNIAGLGAGCEGEPAGSGDFYAAGFADGKECGVNHCADALKATYEELGACAP